MKIVLIYPHQLFEDNILLDKINKEEDIVFLVEDELYFSQYKFHKQKLLLHRASMKKYEDFLLEQKFKVKYIEFKDNLLLSKNTQKVLVYDVTDNYLQKKIQKMVKESGCEIEIFSTPMFLNTDTQNKEFFIKADGTQKKPFMKTFYEWQRTRLNILMLDTNKPVGGKYSFDEDNRKKLPKGYTEPVSINFKKEYESNKYIIEAKEYVSVNFPYNYGEMNECNYAIDFQDAKKIFHNFLEHRLENFGIYEDSISTNFKTINHSVLTPYLNTGLLTPDYIVKETLKYAKVHSKKIPINSLEGFLRQIIGWREFMRAMYVLHGTVMRNGNFFKHNKKLPDTWWSGEVEVDGVKIIPVNNSIKNVLSTGYNHHIERLMILGNFMLLSEYDPKEIYKWFMTMYIDSYDWVMVPNVYGMSQFADGGIFATKPYISGSNYIFKMSDYKKGEEVQWDKIWDKMFWDFLKKHKTFFSKNIRFKMLLSRIKN